MSADVGREIAAAFARANAEDEEEALRLHRVIKGQHHYRLLSDGRVTPSAASIAEQVLPGGTAQILPSSTDAFPNGTGSAAGIPSPASSGQLSLSVAA